MTKPSGCDDFFYNLMKKCWKLDASNRPKFHEIMVKLLSTLSSGDKDFIKRFQKNSYLYNRNSQIAKASFNYMIDFKFAS
jgi:hypothetical protein